MCRLIKIDLTQNSLCIIQGILQDEKETSCETDWATIKWRGGAMHHPVQQDGSTCGIIVKVKAKDHYCINIFFNALTDPVWRL